MKQWEEKERFHTDIVLATAWMDGLGYICSRVWEGGLCVAERQRSTSRIFDIQMRVLRAPFLLEVCVFTFISSAQVSFPIQRYLVSYLQQTPPFSVIATYVVILQIGMTE